MGMSTRVPALCFQTEGVEPGGEVRLVNYVEEPFRGLECEVELGIHDFEVLGLRVDDEILFENIWPARTFHGSPVSLPFARSSMELHVKNISKTAASFRAYVLGRVARPGERLDTEGAG